MANKSPIDYTNADLDEIEQVVDNVLTDESVSLAMRKAIARLHARSLGALGRLVDDGDVAPRARAISERWTKMADAMNADEKAGAIELGDWFRARAREKSEGRAQ